MARLTFISELNPPQLKAKTLLASAAFVRRLPDYGVAGIAIDPFDGSIVGQQLEEVTE